MGEGHENMGHGMFKRCVPRCHHTAEERTQAGIHIMNIQVDTEMSQAVILSGLLCILYDCFVALWLIIEMCSQVQKGAGIFEHWVKSLSLTRPTYVGGGSSPDCSTSFLPG